MKTKEKYWLDPSPECRNCGYLMPERANYCPICSQRNTTGKINVFEFLKEALSNLFNIDAKFFKTLFSFVFPGKLTNEFFLGKHQSFASPIRLFFVTIIFFLAALGWFIQDKIMEADPLGIEVAKAKNIILDSISIYHQTMLTEVKSDAERVAIDSFYNKIITKLYSDTSEVFDGVMFGDSLSIKHKDLQVMSADEIIEKYKIDGPINQMLIKQGMKFNKTPSAFMGSMIGNLTFMFLVLIPALAWFFKLLYIRSKRYYVEHLVFLFHYHSFAFFLGGIMLAAYQYIPDWLMSTLGLLMMIYLVISMRNVYQQSWLKTISKSILIGFAYTIFFSICTFFIMIVSFLLF